MGPILPADMLDASGKKERRAKRLTFIECHGKKKKCGFPASLGKATICLPLASRHPLGAFSHPASISRSPCGEHTCSTACPVPVGAPLTPLPPRQRHPSCVCVFCGSENFSTSGPTESRHISNRARESCVLRNGKECTSLKVKTISVCLYADEHVCVIIERT